MPDDLQSVLDATPVDRSLKADAWDAYNAASDADDFQSRFDALDLPKNTKADLWDLKYGGGLQRPATAPTRSPRPPAFPLAPVPVPPELQPFSTINRQLAEARAVPKAAWENAKGVVQTAGPILAANPEYGGEPARIPTSEQLDAFSKAAEKPLLPISKAFSEPGVMQGVARGLEGATSLKNAGTLAALAGTAAVAPAAGLGAVAYRVLNTGLGAYFANEMRKGVTEETKQAYDAWQKGDYDAVAQHLGTGTVDGLFLLLGLKHVGKSASDVYHTQIELKRQPGETPATEPAEPLGIPPGTPGLAGPTAPGAPKPAPVKPNEVEQVSPDTPNPATAAIHTTPEAPPTLMAQLEELRNSKGGHGERLAVMFSKGTDMPDDWHNLEGMGITHDPFGNVYVFRKDLTTRRAILRAAKQNRLPDILGMVAPDKSELPDNAPVVVKRDANGQEIQSIATSEDMLPVTVAAAQQVTPSGGSVSVEAPAGVVAERAAGPSIASGSPSELPALSGASDDEFAKLQAQADETYDTQLTHATDEALAERHPDVNFRRIVFKGDGYYIRPDAPEKAEGGPYLSKDAAIRDLLAEKSGTRVGPVIDLAAPGSLEPTNPAPLTATPFEQSGGRIITFAPHAGASVPGDFIAVAVHPRGPEGDSGLKELWDFKPPQSTAWPPDFQQRLAEQGLSPENIVGYALIRPEMDNPGKLSAVATHVSGNFRRQGVASALYDAAQQAESQRLGQPAGMVPSTKLSEDAQKFWASRKKDLAAPQSVESAPRASPRARTPQPAPERLEAPAAIEAPKTPETKHEYSSTQGNLSGPVADAMRAYGKAIPDAQLAEDGREGQPHVTVKYGLHTDAPADVAKALSGEPAISITLGKTSLFKTDDGDVLKIDIDSPDLHRLNKKIADALPHTDTHPNYVPHATIAYLKPGEGQKFAGRSVHGVTGQTVTLNHVTFSGKNGEQIDIPLRGKPVAKPAKGSGRIKGASDAGRAEPRERGVPRTGSPAPGRLTGEKTEVIVPGEDISIGTYYQVRDLADIQPSHNGHTFSENPNYAHRNERNYSKAENQQRIVEQSSEEKFNPRYLINDNPDALNGPPIVDEDGHVLGGNSRAMTMQRVYARDGKAAQAYRELLAAKAAQFGVDVEPVRAMKQPILVRVAPDEELHSLPGGSKWAIRKTNVSGSAQLSSSERATADAGQMTPEMMADIASAIERAGPDATLKDALSGKSGTAVVNRLIADGFFSEQERPALMDGKTGVLTQAAKDRISKALLGQFFQDSDQYARFPASIKNKLERVAAPLAKVSDGDWDLTPDVREAVDLIEYAEAHGIKDLKDVVSQQDMFGTAPEWNAKAIRLATILRDEKPNAVVAAFRKYANSREPTMFGESTPQEAFADAFGTSVAEKSKSTSVVLGSGLGGLQPHLEQFAKTDVVPALKSGTRMLSGVFDDIRRTFAPQTRGPQAKIAQGSFRQMMGTLALQDARTHAAMEKFRGILQKLPEEHGVHGLNVIDAIEGGAIPTIADPEVRQFAETARRLYDERKDLLGKLGLVKNFIENYFTHMYKEPKQAEAWTANWISRRPMAGKEAFRKQRTYPTLREALEDPDFGLVARFDNPVDFVYAGLAQMDKSIAAHEVFEEWKEEGYLKFSRRMPGAGWEPINDRLFTVYGPRRGAVQLPAQANIEPEDVTVIGKREMGRYYAPSQMAQVANNYLSPGLRGKSGFDAWMKLKGGMNALNLGFSAFHGLTTTLNASMNDMALGIKQTFAGHPVRGATTFARGTLPFASVVQDVIRGTYLEKVYKGEIANPDAMSLAVVDALVDAGARLESEQGYADLWWKGLRKAWDENNKLGATVRAVNPLLWSELSTKPIMKFLVPRAKLAAFEKAMQFEIEQHPNMTADEARARFGELSDSMDDRLGQLNQPNMLWNNMVRDWMNAIIGRPGWNLGFLRTALGGGVDAIQNLADLARRKPGVTLSHRTAYVIAMVLGGALLNGLTNFLLTGTAPRGMDYIAPRDGGKTEDGHPSRTILPLYLAKDLYSWATRPVTTLLAKLAQPLMVAGQLARNRDFNERKILGRGGTGIGAYLFNLFSPYALTGAMKNVERAESPIKTVLPFVGILPASRRMGLSKAERIITEYQDEQRANTRPAATEHTRARNLVFSAAQRGDTAKAREVGRDQVRRGNLSAQDVQTSLKRAKQGPLVSDVSGIRDVDVLMRVYDAADADEKRLIQKEVRRKIINARGQAYKWTPEARQLAQKYFHITPRSNYAPPAASDLSAPAPLY